MLITRQRDSSKGGRGRCVSTAVHLPSLFVFLMLQEELLPWDVSRRCRQVPGSGYSRGNSSGCQQKVLSKREGEKTTVASLLIKDSGLREGKQDPTPHGALGTCRIRSPPRCSSGSLPRAVLSLSVSLGVARCCLCIKCVPYRPAA